MGDLPSALASAAAFETSSVRPIGAEPAVPEADFRSAVPGSSNDPAAAPATSTLANTNVRAAPRRMRRG